MPAASMASWNNGYAQQQGSGKSNSTAIMSSFQLRSANQQDQHAERMVGAGDEIDLCVDQQRGHEIRGA